MEREAARGKAEQQETGVDTHHRNNKHMPSKLRMNTMATKLLVPTVMVFDWYLVSDKGKQQQQQAKNPKMKNT
jgi:hypothetical protein